MNIITKLTAVTSMAACLSMAAPVMSQAKTTDKATAKDAAQTNAHFSHVKTAKFTAAALPASLKAKEALGNKWLQQGDHNHYVANLQSKLLNLGYYKGEKDGIFGSLTLDAVISFQKNENLGEDGIVGPQTKLALIKTHKHKTIHSVVSSAETNSAPAEKTAAAPQPVNNSTEQSGTASTADGQSITVEATSYSLNGTTATGVNLSAHSNAKVIAVDPKVIPLGSRVYVPGYGVATAADTGGAIKGHRIDVHLSSDGAANQYGRRTITIKVLD